jgi:hypothetical protein
MIKLYVQDKWSLSTSSWQGDNSYDDIVVSKTLFNIFDCAWDVPFLERYIQESIVYMFTNEGYNENK